MKFKKLIRNFTFLAGISTVAIATSVSLTTDDIKEIKKFKLSKDDANFYANIYTGKNGIFDKLNILERRNQLLKEKKLRDFRPALGIIEIGHPKIFDKMLRKGVKQEVIFNNNHYGDNFDYHSTMVTSLAGTNSGVNPFANIYSAAISGHFSLTDVNKVFSEMFKKGVSVVNMSIGERFDTNNDILYKIIKQLQHTSFDTVFNTSRRKFLRNITLNDISEYFNNPKIKESRSYYSIKNIAQNKGNYLTSKGVEILLEATSKALSEVSADYQKRNQFYSELSRGFDIVAKNYNIKVFVSAGNSQKNSSKMAKYYDDLTTFGHEPINFYEQFKSEVRPDTWKTARNIFYVGALESSTNKTVEYSTTGTKYNEDYPFVSSFAGFAGFNNKYNFASNVNPYIRSYNNRYSYKNPDNLNSFSLLHGTSFSSPLVAGMVSLLEYDLQRSISIAELKTALALVSNKTSIQKWDFADTVNSLDYEKETKNGAYHRSGFGFPLYDKLLNYFTNTSQSVLKNFAEVNQNRKTNYAIRKVILKPNETLKVALSWDYVSRHLFDFFDNELIWESQKNKLKFGRYLDALQIVIRDELGNTISTDYDKNDPTFSTVRFFSLKNLSEKNKVFSIGLRTLSKSNNVVVENNDGNISLGYDIE